MSYVSLFRNIPELLSQPIGIAAIASLGIHGAIAMIVPLMPMDSSKPKDTASSKTVGLLELSQADQSRLPQSTPQVGLQQLPPIAPLSAPNFSAQILPPVAPAPSSQLVLPPLPASSNNYRVSSLPTRQSLRMIPSNNLRFDASKFDSSKFNNSPKFNTTPKFSPSASPVNVSESKYEAPQPLAVNRLPELQSQKIPDDILQNAQSPNLPVTSPITTAQVNTTPLMAQSVNGGSRITQNPLINSLKQAPRAGDSLTLIRGTASQAPDLSAKGTQLAIAQLDSYANLRKEVQQQYPGAEQKPVIRQTLPTKKPNLEGAVLGVLVVDPDGKVLDIKFQDKLVSPELKSQAREYFNKQSPKGDKRISSYPFNLNFQNNISNTTGANNQLTPKPFPELQIRNNQPASSSTGTLKPLAAPEVNGNQLKFSPTTAPKPLSELRIRNNQPASLPTGTLKPLSVTGVNSNQSTTSPAVTSKPFPELQIRNNQLTPSSGATTSESLLLPRVNKSQLTPSAESDGKLVEQLRELKEKRQKFSPEK
ncbi:hypothetical protein NIES4072_56510 [Nostoc commune NIES-4072]|uniref:TonB C-terminal domain-containing protein n=1 Tax=Nostoc commune NIES-4072 TaxID=2005467 RepID=A0A2R5FT72_NOSCO|nr:hypothetical protein [Nostoc commune]BBD67054.1 hypothetical protein NIES4070_34420 [Nostoc commune HK-02]GBG21962.1 hypothetical protein NIES4072_56510 [Nostoc commune NIES-4072]